MIIDLFCMQQVLQLFEPGEGAEFEILALHVDLAEEVKELRCPHAGIPSAAELREMLADLVKRNTVTPAVGGGAPKLTSQPENTSATTAAISRTR